MLGGSGGMLPGKILIKMVLSGAMLASQIMLLPTEKPTISRLLNQQQQNIIAICFTPINFQMCMLCEN